MPKKLSTAKNDPSGSSTDLPSPKDFQNWAEFMCRAMENWDRKAIEYADRYSAGPIMDEQMKKRWMRVSRSLDRCRNHMETALAFVPVDDE